MKCGGTCSLVFKASRVMREYACHASKKLRGVMRSDLRIKESYLDIPFIEIRNADCRSFFIHAIIHIPHSIPLTSLTS